MMESRQNGIGSFERLPIAGRNGEQRVSKAILLLAQKVSEEIEACDGPVVARETFTLHSR
jgi:hypothetical protein